MVKVRLLEGPRRLIPMGETQEIYEFIPGEVTDVPASEAPRFAGEPDFEIVEPRSKTRAKEQ